MRGIIELGIWDIWERAPFLPFKTTEKYYLLKSGERDREKEREIKFPFLLMHANTHIHIHTHTFWILCMHFLACLFFQNRAPSRGSDVCVFDAMLLHPWSVDTLDTRCRATFTHSIFLFEAFPKSAGHFGFPPELRLVYSRAKGHTVHPRSPPGLTYVALMAAWCGRVR